MATINNVNNGDSGLDARNKINSNDNALNAELANAVKAADIINNFTTDPADTSKVAGANAVFQLFQILQSNDVNYDTLQEIVNFIKTIDTDGELVAAIDAAVGNTSWREGLGASNGIQKVETAPGSGVFEYRLGDKFTTNAQSNFLSNNAILDFNSDQVQFGIFDDVNGNVDTFFIITGGIIEFVNGKSDNSNLISFLIGNNRIEYLKQNTGETGIVYLGFNETNDTGSGADYSTLAGISLVPRKFVEDLTGLLANLNTTDKTNLVAAINEVLAGGGGGVTTFEALTDAFTFVGNALRFARVNAGETDLEPFDLFGSLNQWTNFNQFDRQVQINQFLTFGNSIVYGGSTLADNLGTSKSVIVLAQISSSNLTINSILPAIIAGDNGNSNRILILKNESENGHNITVNNEGTGLANNRFYLNANLVIPPRESAIFIYRNETTGQDGWYLLSKSFGGKEISQTFRFLDTVTTFEYTQAEAFKIDTITAQAGVTVTVTLSDGTTAYTLGNTVAAFDYLIFSVDVVGSFRIKGTII